MCVSLTKAPGNVNYRKIYLGQGALSVGHIETTANDPLALVIARVAR